MKKDGYAGAVKVDHGFCLLGNDGTKTSRRSPIISSSATANPTTTILGIESGEHFIAALCLDRLLLWNHIDLEQVQLHVAYHRFTFETILFECLHEKGWLCWRSESGSYT